jgi:3-oxoacyl-[acyl-carrier protein] reductase
MSAPVVALVTGATRGIGAAVAARFVRDGAIVYLTGRSIEALTTSAAALSATGPGSAIPLLLDVRDPQSISDAFRTVFTAQKRLDVLVNNAGVMETGMLGGFTADGLASQLAVNTSGTILCLQAAARLMQRAKRGAIINVSSVMATHGGTGQTAYAASKAAVDAATRAAAQELAPWGIRVNAVAPGWIDTELVAHLTDAQREATTRRVPMARAGRPEEVAAAIAFLASSDASYITGAIVAVDGGYVP